MLFEIYRTSDYNNKSHPEAYKVSKESGYRKFKWFIEIEDLIRWVNDLQETVIIHPNTTGLLTELEIYDGYRE